MRMSRLRINGLRDPALEPAPPGRRHSGNAASAGFSSRTIGHQAEFVTVYLQMQQSCKPGQNGKRPARARTADRYVSVLVRSEFPTG